MNYSFSSPFNMGEAVKPVTHRQFMHCTTLRCRTSGLCTKPTEMSTNPEQSKPMGSLLVRVYEPRDRQQMLLLYTDGLIEKVVDTAFRGLIYHPESVLLYFLLTVVCLLLTQSWWMLGIIPALVLCARYYYSRQVIHNYLDHILSTDLKDIQEYYINSPGQCLWVAELDGQVVGMVAALGEDNSETVELHRMSVDKRFRKCGIGIALGQKFIQFSIAQKYSIATLGTTAYSPAAHRLYQRLGFRLVGTTNGYQAPGTTSSLLQNIFYRVRHKDYILDLKSLD